MTTPNFGNNHPVFDGIDLNFRQTSNPNWVNFLDAVNSSEEMRASVLRFYDTPFNGHPHGVISDSGAFNLSVGGQYNPSANEILLPNTFFNAPNTTYGYLRVLTHELVHAQFAPTVVGETSAALAALDGGSFTFNQFVNRLINASIDEEVNAYMADWNAARSANVPGATISGQYGEANYEALLTTSPNGMLSIDNPDAYAAMRNYVVNINPGNGNYLVTNSTHWLNAYSHRIPANETITIPGLNAADLRSAGFRGAVTLADNSTPGATTTIVVGRRNDSSLPTTLPADVSMTWNNPATGVSVQLLTTQAIDPANAGQTIAVTSLFITSDGAAYFVPNVAAAGLSAAQVVELQRGVGINNSNLVASLITPSNGAMGTGVFAATQAEYGGYEYTNAAGVVERADQSFLNPWRRPGTSGTSTQVAGLNGANASDATEASAWERLLGALPPDAELYTDPETGRSWLVSGNGTILGEFTSQTGSTTLTLANGNARVNITSEGISTQSQTTNGVEHNQYRDAAGHMIGRDAQDAQGNTLYWQAANGSGYLVGANGQTISIAAGSAVALGADSIQVTTPSGTNTETIQSYTFNAAGQRVIQSTRIVETFYDDNDTGSSRTETVTTSSGTVRNVYNNDNTLFSATPLPSSGINNLAASETASAVNDLLQFGQLAASGTRPAAYVFASGVTLLNRNFNPLNQDGSRRYPAFGTVGTVAQGALAVYGLHTAFSGSGSDLARVSATGGAINFVNQNLLSGGGNVALNTALNGGPNGLLGGTPGILPAIGLISAIKTKDPIGIIQGTIGLFNPALLFTSGVGFTPLGWVLIAASILRIAFAKGPPKAWGVASVTYGPGFNNLLLQVNASGESFGTDKAKNTLQGIATFMQEQVNAINAQQAVGQQVGLVAQRMPSLTWRASDLSANQTTDNGHQSFEQDEYAVAAQNKNASLLHLATGRVHERHDAIYSIAAYASFNWATSLNDWKNRAENDDTWRCVA
jgi:hypothetical protein